MERTFAIKYGDHNALKDIQKYDCHHDVLCALSFTVVFAKIQVKYVPPPAGAGSQDDEKRGVKTFPAAMKYAICRKKHIVVYL